ncbi:hypothetical protein E2C01_010092 [Portunus trituberculatus]|uniref:Uncharacterized protein n=1 Tax=Portunus trituberculatus TaxID=210409 RepID=A0A5B7D7P8_PORTR|nr:hypothetical protein [Portunus trituberculatus]
MHLHSGSASSTAFCVPPTPPGDSIGQAVNDQLIWNQHSITTVRSIAYWMYLLHRVKSLLTPADELKERYLTFILPKLMIQLQNVQKEGVPDHPASAQAVYQPDTENLRKNLGGACCVNYAYDIAFP